MVLLIFSICIHVNLSVYPVFNLFPQKFLFGHSYGPWLEHVKCFLGMGGGLKSWTSHNYQSLTHSLVLEQRYMS